MEVILHALMCIRTKSCYISIVYPKTLQTIVGTRFDVNVLNLQTLFEFLNWWSRSQNLQPAATVSTTVLSNLSFTDADKHGRIFKVDKDWSVSSTGKHYNSFVWIILICLIFFIKNKNLFKSMFNHKVSN